MLIEPGQCGVWWADARLGGTAHAAEVLTSAERERAERFRRPADRDRMIVAWALTRTLLGTVLDIEPARIDIVRSCAGCGSDAHGKPALADASIGLEFSVSHSGDWVLVAVTTAAPVGVDVEQLKEHTDYDRLLRRMATDGELSTEEPVDPRDAVRVWVRKEAVTKAVGTGLATSFGSFAVSAPSAPAALLTWPADDGLPARTTLSDLDGRGDHLAAVAVLRAGVDVVEHDGSDLLAG
jgi:4'-phosphopantetheinyl transferase